MTSKRSTSAPRIDAYSGSLSPGASVTTLPRVGPAAAERLARLGIHAIQDLLFHLPYRYEDRTRLIPIGRLRPGSAALVQGVVELSDVQLGRRRALLTRLSDGTGALTLRFFHFNDRQRQALQRGVHIRCYGIVRGGPRTLEMVHPEYRLLADPAVPVEEALTPVYPATEGLPATRLRALVGAALDLFVPEAADARGLEELVPRECTHGLLWPSLGEALRFVHRPAPSATSAELGEGRHPAQQRLAFEELLAHHVSLRQLRLQTQRHRAPRLRPVDSDAQGLVARFVAGLPFALTAAQRRVIGEILGDLVRGAPMQRLLQGDVGSGKTVVAAVAVLTCVAAGWPAVVMAPTELLAEQHARTFSNWFEPLGIDVPWLSGRLKGSARESLLQRVAGSVPFVAVGTHALFQAGVTLAPLGLVVIDEQHRFGVDQRLALLEKGKGAATVPHQLVMTATPIPRTLAMMAYADLDNSVLDELPPGRTPVATVVLPDSRRAEVVERVRSVVRRGAQVYWICTTVEESELLQTQAACETQQQLAQFLPELNVGLVHGRMSGREKEDAMAQFKAGTIDLLVATTVVEVGVDVPNASLMVIENAERLGLAQLHQLRGRVGRGVRSSSCVLMYHGQLSAVARARLATLRETNDGFEIARRDLELRGPGEVLGTRQTGPLQMRIADLARDGALLPLVERAGGLILNKYPDHVAPLIQRWIGDAGRYGEV